MPRTVFPTKPVDPVSCRAVFPPIQGSDEHLHALISNQAESLPSVSPQCGSGTSFSYSCAKALVRALQGRDPTADYVAGICTCPAALYIESSMTRISYSERF